MKWYYSFDLFNTKLKPMKADEPREANFHMLQSLICSVVRSVCKIKITNYSYFQILSHLLVKLNKKVVSSTKTTLIKIYEQKVINS